MQTTSAPIVTYWLKRGSEIVGSVRMPVGTRAQDVITRALDAHERVPLCYPESPYTHACKIRTSQVFLYPDGNPGEPAVVTEVR